MNGRLPVLEARGLRVPRAGNNVLDIPELKIYAGEILCLIGPNGAGKTTLLHALNKLIKATAGEIILDGFDDGPRRPPHLYRRNFAMVFQEPLLFSGTVFENVASGLKIRGRKRTEVRAAVEAQMARFGISHLKNRPARMLSGGEAQRVSLARAFATGPRVLLLDEPFASLDAPAREGLMADLERAVRDTATATVFATHDRVEALRLSDRIAVMNAGRIVQTGRPGEIMQRPADEFVASFVGTETVLAGEVTRAGDGTFCVAVSDREIEVTGEAAPGESVTIGIRPENVVLSAAPAATTSARNNFEGTISRITPMGPYYRVHVECGFPLIAHVTGHAVEGLGLAGGMKIVASFKATSVHVIKRSG